MTVLLPDLHDAQDKTALRFGDRTLTYAELATVAGVLARRLRPTSGDPRTTRVAVWATPGPETAVATVAALLAGVPVVPINPGSGTRELDHIVADSTPVLLLAEPGAELPSALHHLPRIDVALPPTGTTPPAQPTPPEDEPDPEAPAFVIYTSGTTGPPKGVLIPRRAIASSLDALADAWGWTADDVLVHGLPLFHVHGLVLGILGPLRRGGTVHHLGRFTTGAVARELAGPATMLFGVPTMYHRLATELDHDTALVDALRRARLLVSGSAPLPVYDHRRIMAATGRRVVERYGMTETLMNTSVRPDGAHRPGTVGTPLRDVSLRLVDEADNPLDVHDGETVGEVEVRGPNLFTGYLNRPDATAEAFHDGWFRTGDMATRDADGHLRPVGRKSTDLIKSGGYRIGAGEIENALLEHPNVAEVAVTGEPDPDLGERIVAWVVPDGARPGEEELADHVTRALSAHKRPRVVRYLDALPRNDMGKILKKALHE